MYLHSEIFEQPAVLQGMYRANREIVQKMTKEIGAVPSVVVAARGTSDNAARYAKYVWGAFSHLSVTLATPSLFSLYKKPPKMQGSLVMGISQSGQPPDILNVIREGNAQGCPTLAITNHPDSPLGEEADFVIDIQAGVEKAVAATKTYTAQLQAIAMLSAAWARDEERWDQIAQLPEWCIKALDEQDSIAQSALRYRYMDQCVILGRGFNYATAFEWSLKLKELTYVLAEPYSSADFQHGPIAMVANGFPVFAVAPHGAVFNDVLELLCRLKDQHLAELFIISDREEALELATTPVAIPGQIPEWLTPIVSILPAQLFCYHLTKVKNYDPDKPRGLQKVTLTY